MISATESGEGKIPSHVPRELIKSFDFRTGLGDDPHAAIAALHNGPPIIFSPVHHNTLPESPGTWIPVRAADIRAVLQDPVSFSSNLGRSINKGPKFIPLEVDPPLHTKYRVLMNPLFSPKKILEMEAKIRMVSRELIDKVLPKGGCDFVESFACPFPIGIFIGLMGLPHEQMDQFMEWENLIMRDRSTRATGIKHVCEYLSTLIVQRRHQPSDDLISFVVKCKIDDHPLEDADVLGICLLLFIGGLDTVASSFGFYLRHLALHPLDQKALRADPSLVPDAVEEFLRAYAIVNTGRVATCDTELAGVQIKKGDHVTCSTVLACHDPLEFPDPANVDIYRSPNLHNAFSYGPHRCIGSHLARRELVIGLQEWLARIPEFSIKPGTRPEYSGGGVLSVDKLELVW